MAPGNLLGWGAVGHETVAFIAQDRLTPQARDEVRNILGSNENLASVSTWADSIVENRPETAPWHYLNLDVRQLQNVFDLSGSCKNHDCVVDQILKDLGILRKPFAPRKEKREALKFLVHFLGIYTSPCIAWTTTTAAGTRNGSVIIPENPLTVILGSTSMVSGTIYWRLKPAKIPADLPGGWREESVPKMKKIGPGENRPTGPMKAFLSPKGIFTPNCPGDPCKKAAGEGTCRGITIPGR